MSRLRDFFAGHTVSTVVERARRKFAAGKLDDAAQIVERGLERFPASSNLLDLQLSVRRAHAHKSIRRLEERIEQWSDPLAYEELIRLYQELALPDEARRKAEQYCAANDGHDSPHLILGEMNLEAFYQDLQARHGHAAHDHLLRAAGINLMAIQPRLLLAELYFCIGAPCSLAAMHQSLMQMAPERGMLETVFLLMRAVADPTAKENMDGLFERIETDGALRRDPADWPTSSRRTGQANYSEDDVDPVIEALIEEGSADELVVLRRDGSMLTHVSPMGTHGDESETSSSGDEPEVGFVHIVRTIVRKVFPQASELDMGKLRRCTVRGSIDNLVVGRVGHLLVGARGTPTGDPLRMWERVSARIEGALRGETT